MAMLDYDSEEELGSFAEPIPGLSPEVHGLVRLFLFQTYLGDVSDTDIEVVRFCDQTLLERAFLEAVSVARDALSYYPEKGDVEATVGCLLEIKQYIASQFNRESEANVRTLFCSLDMS
jgi:hypothetical protein